MTDSKKEKILCHGVTLNLTKPGWQKVGKISVDAGICWLGDPCYVLPDRRAGLHKGLPNKEGLNYIEMVNAMHATSTLVDNGAEAYYKEYNVHAFDHYEGIPGKGFCVSAGYGDGCYDVFVKATPQGVVKEMKVVFIDASDEDVGDSKDDDSCS